MKKFVMIMAAMILVCLVLVARPAYAKSMYQRAVGAKSTTGWCVVVNKSAHVVAVYKIKEGKTQRYVSYRCTVGRLKNGRSITRSGLFKIGSKHKYLDLKRGTAFYCTFMSGPKTSGYIHSGLYEIGSRNVGRARAVDTAMGRNRSDGCVRLPLWGAYFVWTLPKGTPIVIF